MNTTIVRVHLHAAGTHQIGAIGGASPVTKGYGHLMVGALNRVRAVTSSVRGS